MSWSPPEQDSLNWAPPKDEQIGDAEPEGRGFVQEMLRQLGLTGRYLIEGGLGLADLAAEPIRMGMRQVLPEQYAPRGTGGQAIANLIGLPQPETGSEKVVADLSRALAGAGGGISAAKALSGRVVPAAEKAVNWFAANPSLQAQAAIGAGTGAAVAREAELGPYGTLLAQLAGGVAAPGAIRATRAAVEPIMDIGATIGAAGGSQRGIRRVSSDAMERGLGESREATRTAMYQATEMVPGAKPTVAQALAEANAKPSIAGPERVVGGYAARLEKDLSGARGIEDVLPSVYKGQEAALDTARKVLEKQVGPIRDRVLSAVNDKGGLEWSAVSKRLDDLAANPEIAGDPAMARAVSLARRRMSVLAKDGRVDAKAAYAFRKSVNKTVSRAAESAEGTTTGKDQRKMGWIARQIQGTIDDSIEDVAKQSGLENQWATYRTKYAEGSRQIESHIERAEAAGELAGKVKPLGSQVVPGEIPQPPTLLNRKMMLANWGLRLLGKDANEPIVKDLAQRMSDPKAFAELLSRPAKDPLRVWALEAIKRGEQAAAMGLITNSDSITQ